MTPRWLIISLVFALPILVVTFAVVLGASVLARGLGDAAGSNGLFWSAMVALLLLVIDALTLLVVLGLLAINEPPDQH